MENLILSMFETADEESLTLNFFVEKTKASKKVRKEILECLGEMVKAGTITAEKNLASGRVFYTKKRAVTKKYIKPFEPMKTNPLDWRKTCRLGAADLYNAPSRSGATLYYKGGIKTLVDSLHIPSIGVAR